jgi:hypothetical protein
MKKVSKKRGGSKTVNSVSNSKIHDPLKSYGLICDTGLVSDKSSLEKKLKLESMNNLLGELNDVYCVSKGAKPLAALDFSSYGKKKLKKRNIEIKNKVIDYCNSMGVNALHNTQTGGMYLKTIFFLPENMDNALKLMFVLWYPDAFLEKEKNNIAIGILLGYDYDNIIAFVKKNYGITVNKVLLKKVEEYLKKMKVSFEDLQVNYKIKLLTSIKNL